MQAAQFASDSHRYRWLWKHKVPEQMIPWEFGTETDIDSQIEIEAGRKAFVVRKNKTKHKRSEECRVQRRQVRRAEIFVKMSKKVARNWVSGKRV